MTVLRSAPPPAMLLLALPMLLLLWIGSCNAFMLSGLPSADRTSRRARRPALLTTTTTTTAQQAPISLLAPPSSPLAASQYEPPTGGEASESKQQKQQQQPPGPPPLYPNVGDLVRYYELDGGKADGEVLVGKITFIQKNAGGEGSGWTLEATELEDLGEGYYGDYPARKRNSKRTLRDLTTVSPVAGTFVRTENAFKVPYDKATNVPKVRAERYDVDGYEGPFSGDNAIDPSVLERDAVAYGETKGRLLKAVVLFGLVGTLVADLTKGTEDAVVYAAGVFGSLAYLFLLSLKADSVASPGAKFGKWIANVRWLMPILLVAGVALYDQSLGDANPVLGKGLFNYVTAEQFGAVVLGFLTYRIPLLVLQLMDVLNDTDEDGGEMVLPGSVGIAMQLGKEDKKDSKIPSAFQDEAALPTVLLVSGPQATGRSGLVERLVAEGEGRYVGPDRVDRIKDGATFERLERREEFLEVDATGRYGTTRGGILSGAKACGPDKVVVMDADVGLARELAKIGGVRLVGVWIGLGSVQEFEDRLAALIDSGEIEVPEGETRYNVMRARIREIVQEIEFGISSGIFEFTILNKDEEESLKQLKAAAAYCFK